MTLLFLSTYRHVIKQGYIMKKLTREQIKKKIQILLNLIECGKGSEPEQAARHIQRLMKKYHMAWNEISDVDEVLKEKIGDVGNNSWERTLVRYIAHYFNCRYAYGCGNLEDEIVGFPEDIECTLFLFEVAKRKINASATLARINGEIKGRRAINGYRNSMVLGFSIKLESLRNEHNRDNPQYGLVLRQRNHTVNEWVRNNCRWGSRSSRNYESNDLAFERGSELEVQSGLKGPKPTLRLSGK